MAEAVDAPAMIMLDAKAAPAARVAAANTVVDRGCGKAPQHISGEFLQRFFAELPQVSEDGDEWEHRYSPKRHYRLTECRFSST
jgi:hypothetical protein